MAQKTFTQLLAELNFYDFVGKLRILFTKLNTEKLTASQATTITALGVTTDLTAISASYADLAAARTSVNALKGEVETRLDNIEAKIDDLIAKLKTAGIIATV